MGTAHSKEVEETELIDPVTGFKVPKEAAQPKARDATGSTHVEVEHANVNTKHGTNLNTEHDNEATALDANSADFNTGFANQSLAPKATAAEPKSRFKRFRRTKKHRAKASGPKPNWYDQFNHTHSFLFGPYGFNYGLECREITTIRSPPPVMLSKEQGRAIFKTNSPRVSFVIDPNGSWRPHWRFWDASGLIADWKGGAPRFMFPEGSIHSSHPFRMIQPRWYSQREYFHKDGVMYTWKLNGRQGLMLSKGDPELPRKIVARYQKISSFRTNMGVLVVDSTEIDMAIAVLTCWWMLMREAQRQEAARQAAVASSYH